MLEFFTVLQSAAISASAAAIAASNAATQAAIAAASSDNVDYTTLSQGDIGIGLLIVLGILIIAGIIIWASDG